jgi:hypothetical protein
MRRKAGKANSPSGSSETETSNTAATGNGQHEEDRDSAQSKGSSYGATYTETLREVTSEDGLLPGQQAQGHVVGSSNGNNNDAQHDGSAPGNGASAVEEAKFKVYKRRWFGVVQLVLLNTIVSWDVSTTPFLTSLKCSEISPNNLNSAC